MSDEKDRKKNSNVDHQEADKQTTTSAGKSVDRFLKRLTALPLLPLAPDEPTNEEFQTRTFRGRKE